MGDYFDDFNDNQRHAFKTARWLKKMISRKNTTMLVGNHDASYMYNARNNNLRCSGFTFDKSVAINSVLSTEDWKGLQWAKESQGWMMTHAGMNSDLWVNFKGFDKDKFMEGTKDLHDKMMVSSKSDYFNIGSSRGGWDLFGGILWSDYNMDFKDIDNIKQIFGHTREDGVVRQYQNTDNYCIDTELMKVAMIVDGKIEIIDCKKYQKGKKK